MNAPLMQIHGLTLRRAKRTLCQGLEFDISPGDVLAVLGENGAGKSTLLLTLAGLLPADAAAITLRGHRLAGSSRKYIARHLGMLLQEHVDLFPMTVNEAALLGRYAHLAPWQPPNAKDLQRVRRALQQLGLEALAQRDVTTLSGGERRRLGLATLLVQDPQIYLLDEPSNHLDLRHQIQSLDQLTGQTREQQRAVVFATHDLNLAARYSNKTLLLFQDGSHKIGNSQELLVDNELSKLYDFPIHSLRKDGITVYYPGLPDEM